MPYQEEALSWLRNNKSKPPLASNHFQTKEKAIEAVERLYTAGAIQVEAVVLFDELWRIERFGGPYADTLEVTLPEKGREKLIAVIKSLKPGNFEGIDDGLPDTEVNPVWTLRWD